MGHALHATGMFLAGWALMFLTIGWGFIRVMRRNKDRTAAALAVAIAAAATHESAKRPAQVPPQEPLEPERTGLALQEKN